MLEALTKQPASMPLWAMFMVVAFTQGIRLYRDWHKDKSGEKTNRQTADSGLAGAAVGSLDSVLGQTHNAYDLLLKQSHEIGEMQKTIGGLEGDIKLLRRDLEVTNEKVKTRDEQLRDYEAIKRREKKLTDDNARLERENTRLLTEIDGQRLGLMALQEIIAQADRQAGGKSTDEGLLNMAKSQLRKIGIMDEHGCFK